MDTITFTKKFIEMWSSFSVAIVEIGEINNLQFLIIFT